MMDIDWLAVDMVCQGTPLALNPSEKKMVIRRLSHRMLSQGDWYWSQTTASKLTAAQVAERLQTTERSVQRMRDELPDGERQVCPVCRQDMWVVEGRVEAHPDSLFEQCPMSMEYLPAPVRGLAALRPDLFAWLPLGAVGA
jgi:hypothetical protein